jgi:hypothetical protein
VWNRCLLERLKPVFYAALGARPKIRKTIRISYYEFLPIWFLPQLWSLLVLDEFNNLSTERRSDLCPDAYAILIAIPIHE